MKKLLAHINALGDRVHPIVVLMLRKQKFWHGFLPLTVGTHIVLFLIMWCGNRLAYDFGPSINAFGSAYLSLALVFPFVFPFGMAVNGYHIIKKSDPLLLLIPLSDRSIWIGFYLAGLYQGVAIWCWAVLMLSYCYALQWVPLEWVLLYPLLSLLTGCLFGTLGMSMSVAAKTVVQRCFLFPIFFVPMWCIMMLLLQPPQVQSWMLRSLFHSVPSSLFEPICWIPMLVLAVPAYLWTAWKLFNFNLVRRRSFILKYCVSIFVYATLTALLVGLWFALRLVLGGV